MRLIQKKTSTFEIIIFRAAAKHRAIHYIFAATGLFFSTQSRFQLLRRNLEIAAKDALRQFASLGSFLSLPRD